ncbi:MAG: GTPase HflX [Nitrososphaerota archaeon]|nr:GTPase HflX [Nitrososphaerota archaeon]MDG7025138.1 GTPase HflX [Nitrososphaerota archaeon]
MHHTAENALLGRRGSDEKATVITYPDRFSRQEILELAEAAGYRVQEVITQKQIIRSEYGIGVGKAQELQEIVAENGSKTIIIDESVTSSQANNLSKVTQAEVVDRERLVLNIFARRANTTEAKLQVRLAELRYEMPRAKDAVRFSVKGERAGFSGMGESAVDVKIRALKRQMVLIGQKLEKSRTNRELYTVERRKLNMPFVSLAGYTSSGKTTLFNRLASESKEESPKLFTTLSTTTRAVAFADSRKKIMLSDTVGFISRLPPYMFESFKSTLDELRYADLILLLIDAGEPVESIRIKLESCRETLFGLEVDPKKTLLVLNKIDRIEDERKRRIEQEPIFSDFASITISAKRGDGLHQLKNRIVGLVFPPKPPI